MTTRDLLVLAIFMAAMLVIIGIAWYDRRQRELARRKSIHPTTRPLATPPHPAVTVTTDRPVDEHDLQALRYLLESVCSGDVDELYDVLVAQIAEDEAEATLDGAIERIVGKDGAA